MCSECRALIEREAEVCPFCGARTRPTPRPSGPGAQRLLGVIPVPATATSVLVVANLALFAVAWYLSFTAASDDLRLPSAWGGVSSDVLLSLGAKSPHIFAGQWWRLVTAMFLHAGLLHIGFNLWCLVDLGPEVESLFSRAKFVVFYLVTGFTCFLASLWWRPFGISVGASGAVLGLIGILIGASFHHGHLGSQFRRQLWRWVLYIFIFGLFFRVDNAAHFGGLATGVLLGYSVPEGEPATVARAKLWNTLAVLAVLVIAGSFALMALHLVRLV